MRVALLLPLLPLAWADGVVESDTSFPTLRCSAEVFDKLLQPQKFDFKITSIEAQAQHNYSSNPDVPATPSLPLQNDLNFCQVIAFLTHHDANDNVRVEVWLPLSEQEWNGRLQATGGAGFATGMFDAHLGIAIKNGWAAVSTDGGHDPISWDGSWALNKDRTVNWNLLANFAYRSPTEQIVIGKAITELFFKRKARSTYWNGCSTGGRQGYYVAQQHPDLVDGILANAPAINFPHLVLGDFWPQVQMQALNTFMSQCELGQYRAKVIEKCDPLDGVFDGIVEDPGECEFDPHQLVHDKWEFECDGKVIKFTEKMAELLKVIQQGTIVASESVVFPGLPHAVPLNVLANITVNPDGTRGQSPFRISTSFLKYLLLKDPEYDVSTLNLQTYLSLFGLASYEYGGVLATDNPDLSALKASGTKMITWHGLYDQMISYHNTVTYRQRVESVMGGPHEVDKFYRLFLVPGVEHCGGGSSPHPKDPLDALVQWVEEGIEPEILEAEIINHDGELVTRDICTWPAKSKYMGVGDANRASSWSCVGGTERPTVESEKIGSRAQNILGSLIDRFGGLGLGLSIE